MNGSRIITWGSWATRTRRLTKESSVRIFKVRRAHGIETTNKVHVGLRRDVIDKTGVESYDQIDDPKIDRQICLVPRV